jgi:cystathionine gamma-lyase/homocysteine desulfhydrase
MERHSENAQTLATYLRDHPAVSRVLYPGLPDDPGHRVARKQMSRFGGMLSFDLRDPSNVRERLRRLEVVTLGESLGAIESLIEHPATMTHHHVPPEQRAKQGITDGLIRLSVGLEDSQDLVEDLGRALG